MRVKFTWDTMISKEEEEYNIEDMSKDSLISIIKILFSQVPGFNQNKNICFNLQDYFVYQVKMKKRKSSIGVTKEDLEEVICLISKENNFVEPVIPVLGPILTKYIH